MRRATTLPLLLAVVACRGDGPASSLPTTALAEQAAEDAEAPAEIPAPRPERELWWDDGDGREAILARERRDHESARRLLESYLAVPDLDADERGAASLLLGLEHLSAREYEAAAAAFALAREAPALSAIDARLRLLEAQALLDAGKPERARDLLEGLAPGDPLEGPIALARADALSRLDDLDGARRAYETVLAGLGQARRASEARAKLARLLERAGEKDALMTARELWERVLLDVPLSDFGKEASKRLAALHEKLGAARKGREARAFERQRQLAEIDATLARRQYARAEKAASKFLSTRKLSNLDRCRALYMQGTAIFKQRKRAEARTSFDRAAVVCQKAGEPAADYTVKSRYQGGRGWFAAGKHVRAARAFEGLAGDWPGHSYADDAWLLAGESWQEAGKLDAARRAYGKVATLGGDMANEGWRRLAMVELTEGREAKALAVLDDALKRGIGNRRERSKAHYLRGRTLARLGRPADARAAYLQAIDALPLDYPALQSLSRLQEMGDEAWREGLARLERPAAGLPSLDAPPGAGVRRARLLARLGLGPEAAEELKAAGISGWPAVSLLTQAGLYEEAQRALGNLGQEWKTSPPMNEATRRLWSLAHPRPFSGLVGEGESSHGVPTLLAYGIMQTESRFNPGATSWAGARGLIQLMPATAADVARKAGRDLSDPSLLYDPATNLDLGIRYLGSLVARFGGGDGAPALAVPSYNAGAGAVDRWLSERGHWDLDLFIEAIPYDETRKYVQKVLGRWYAYRWLYGSGEPEARVPHIPLAIPSRVHPARG